MNYTQRRIQSGLKFLLTGFVAIFAVSICSVASAADPLASWNQGPAKKAIIEFVAAVTDKSSKDYVEPANRRRIGNERPYGDNHGVTCRYDRR
jgi:hypothetical protein